MAVEARHLNLFPPQLIPNQDILTNPMDATIMNMYATQMGNYSMQPLSGTTTASETFRPAAPPLPYSSLSQKTDVLKSDNSTVTNNNVVSVSRKRSRGLIHDTNYHFHSYLHKNTDTFSFLGEDISLNIHHQQLDLATIISRHMEKVKVELEEKLKKQARRLIEAIEAGMMKSLKAKEEEILKIEKLNGALEEKVRSLCIENQIWRDLAQTNEATANALRTNLEQLLAQFGADGGGAAAAPAMEEDAESCCGSSDEGWRTVATGAQDKEGEGTSGVKENNNDNDGRSGGVSERRLCRKCGKEESCVLILPCRHLCLCTVCGSSVHACPVCKSFKNASVHVSMT
ncbi:BOI-related E3 ubiquitin-protein ligase 3 [Spatholobus suberectus]|nr:BOI-related E3 ubiquitin-protein ligase 3 [Spatholobus suberectus]